MTNVSGTSGRCPFQQGTAVSVVGADPRDGRVRRDLSVVLHWLRDYVSKPSEQLGRSGPVCPFVPASLNAGAVSFVFHYQVDGHEPGPLLRLVSAELRRFRQTAEPAERPQGSLSTLLVVLPDADEIGWATIDRTYVRLKNEAVAAGLMIGQFHPACTEPAVRNPTFPVSRAPIALYAIRHMAQHDVLFLHGERRWFAEYERRFSERYSAGKVRDPLLRDLYEQARQRFSQQVAATGGEVEP
ncbi:hypothetical protein Arub01_34020 [Actinomadura rubrobrunea]|uniref:DUF6875 domain-containing protein n=1 Tax=Actinomadura rubrobrunea TaxID=115335 RepID=A0A9W6PY75_9ACTN|nr:hypothetical protein [Actinomadura rubrobrunea]GLW65158.1 hypothetical protein Arub01_34020 [Actinomadura rubrobrunea]